MSVPQWKLRALVYVKKIIDSSIKDKCYADVGVEAKNASPCEKIGFSSEKDRS